MSISTNITVDIERRGKLREGKCPKCGSDEIYAGIDVAPKSGPFASNSIPVGLFSIAALDNYVCAQCGYLESYVADGEKLEEISRKWRKIKKPFSSDENPDE
jgi:predicted nucleic-acid-binding Zn-ribbon protein